MAKRWPCIVVAICTLFAVQPWEPKTGFADAQSRRNDIQARLARIAQQYPGSEGLGESIIVATVNDKLLVAFRCLPDTVDPRGPKGK